ncbi:MAG: thiol peroxidase [bacterium]
MNERKGAVTFQGNPLTLVGDEVKVGERAPDAELLDNALAPVKLSSFRGRIAIVTSVPSLDTPVCDMETRRFNQEAGKLGQDVVVLAVSMDLPFAQKRWCAAAGVEWVRTLSDHRSAGFGTAFGVLIKELRLLARSVFILDREGIVRYAQHVKEITNEPNYDEVFSAAKGLVDR